MRWSYAGGEGLLSRKSSGNVYDNFPCVRVGDYDLPSSMDLRQYLDEMQEVGEWEEEPADLPTIPDDEVSCNANLLSSIHCEAKSAVGMLQCIQREAFTGLPSMLRHSYEWGFLFFSCCSVWRIDMEQLAIAAIANCFHADKCAVSTLPSSFSWLRSG